MPHADRDVESPKMTVNGTADGQLVNGEKPQSLTLQHLQSYPLVSDFSKAYEENPYGAKTISIANEAYARLVTPVEPYLKTPYSYIAPYLKKADSLGETGLKKVDEKFPIVKEETASLKEKASGVATLPVKYINDGREYVFGTYNEEYKKTGGQGIVTTVKAIISTEIRITAEAFKFLADFIQAKQDEAKKQINEKTDNN